MAIRQKLITVDEFEAHIALPENSERLFELINGEIVEKMPTEEHMLIIGNIYLYVRLFSDKNDLGRVAFEVRRKIPGDKHNARLPDLEFTSKERLLPVVKKGAVPQMPDLAVEVQTPDSSDKEMADKAAYYLANGVAMVWLIYPDRRIVEVITPDERHLLNEDGVIDGGSVLPDFKLAVRAIFPAQST
jgi:Uma2 family endonuclease